MLANAGKAEKPKAATEFASNDLNIEFINKSVPQQTWMVTKTTTRTAN